MRARQPDDRIAPRAVALNDSVESYQLTTTGSARRDMATRPSKLLQTFANPSAARDYLVHIEAPEFTCLCPMTGQPDFATLVLDYVPDRRNVELKSLKLYLWSYRNEGTFHEAVTNRILDDLVKALAPRFMRLTARWYVRGGIFTTVVAEHRKRGWKPAPHVDLGRFEASSSTRG
jgi:7-cyano-7-deazaguanine reductase